MAPEYSAMNRVFGELTKWLPNYTPKSIIDFGSGVGSVSWYTENFDMIYISTLKINLIPGLH
jgi:ribosomal protein RSM22 (predicted rRNA methylase)